MRIYTIKWTEPLQQLKADSLFYRAQAIIKSFAEESAANPNLTHALVVKFFNTRNCPKM